MAGVLALLFAAATAVAAGGHLAPAPVQAPAGERIVAVATGLTSGGRYELTLVAPPPPHSPSTCLARIGAPARAGAGRLTFRGSLPRHLRCLLNDGSAVSSLTTPVGKALLVACVPAPGTPLCDGSFAIARAGFRVLSAPLACARVIFQPGTEAEASSIRASGVDCRTARAVAATAKEKSAACFGARGRCSYPALRFVCQGRRRPSGLPRVDFVCTRPGARVTFLRT